MSQTKTALTTPLPDTAFEGIILGRTLLQIEKALGIPAERLLALIRLDEGANIAFKEARELSAFVIEDQITDKLAENAENPQSAVKNTALKVWSDHMHWVAERRNAAVYSGKAPVNVTVPIQITTSLDLGHTKSIEGVYELVAESLMDVPKEDIPPAALPVSPIEARATPFGGLLADAVVGTPFAEAEKANEPGETGHSEAGRATGVDQEPPVAVAGEQSEAPRQFPAKSPRAPRKRARKEPAVHATIPEAQA